MSLSILCGLNVNLSCGRYMQIHFTSFTRTDILGFEFFLWYRWNWELRHLFYALNCWHSEHDRCWHSELYISLDGICKKTRPPRPLQNIYRYLYFTSSSLSLFAKFCNSLAAIIKLAIRECQPGCRVCRSTSVQAAHWTFIKCGLKENSNRAITAQPLLGAQSIDSSCVYRQ